ncbi:hypothetical protein V8G54_020802, partial [Vigna mungo]
SWLMVEDKDQFEAFEEEELEVSQKVIASHKNDTILYILTTSKLKEPIYNNIPNMYNKGANKSKPCLLKTADIRIKTNFSMELLSLDEFQIMFLLRPWQNRDDSGERAAPPKRL